MNTKTEAKILAHQFNAVRGLTRFYLSKLHDAFLFKQYSIEGKAFNSAYWIAAHLVWSEHSLVIEGLGGEKLNIPWLGEFSIGSDAAKKDSWPDYDEVLKRMDEVHERAINLITSMSDEELDKPNLIDANFMGNNTKRSVLMHAIRHEPMHVGQISWILKINCIEMP
jgi:uncharacterized damage-inducible protein DinB